MAGIALSHAAGQSDYDVTVASGSLESRLTSVLPYLRWKCSTGLTEVWSIVGLGTGEVDVEDAASDLSMRMAMVGTRMRVAGTGGTGLDVIGDAGLLRLSTADSESPSLSDIESDVQRVRIGLEGSRTSTLAGGTTITPYAQVAGRYDGGTGQTGQGLEVAGGLRLSGGRVGVNAQGRFLAVHTADGYSENGFSVAAYLNPGAGGTGLSMSVAPRIGAGTGDSGMMWRDRPLAGTSSNGRDNTRAFKAEVGYGLAYPRRRPAADAAGRQTRPVRFSHRRRIPGTLRYATRSAWQRVRSPNRSAGPHEFLTRRHRVEPGRNRGSALHMNRSTPDLVQDEPGHSGRPDLAKDEGRWY